MMGSTDFAWYYGENACTGGRQDLQSMRTSIAFLPIPITEYLPRAWFAPAAQTTCQAYQGRMPGQPGQA
jgi:hypothetical protein